MKLKFLTLPLFALAFTACESSKHGYRTLPPPEDAGVDVEHMNLTLPVTKVDKALASPLVFGPATVINRRFDQYKYAISVENRGIETLCKISVVIRVRGDEWRTGNDMAELEAPLMREDGWPSRCLAPNAKGYILSSFQTSLQAFDGLEATTIYATANEKVKPFTQVSMVEQSFQGPEIAFTLRNETSQNLNSLFIGKWLLRNGDRILDWGYVENPRGRGLIAPQETFQLKGLNTLIGPAPSGTVLELVQELLYDEND